MQQTLHFYRHSERVYESTLVSTGFFSNFFPTGKLFLGITVTLAECSTVLVFVLFALEFAIRGTTSVTQSTGTFSAIAVPKRTVPVRRWSREVLQRIRILIRGKKMANNML